MLRKFNFISSLIVLISFNNIFSNMVYAIQNIEMKLCIEQDTIKNSNLKYKSRNQSQIQTVYSGKVSRTAKIKNISIPVYDIVSKKLDSCLRADIKYLKTCEVNINRFIGTFYIETKNNKKLLYIEYGSSKEVLLGWKLGVKTCGYFMVESMPYYIFTEKPEKFPSLLIPFFKKTAKMHVIKVYDRYPTPEDHTNWYYLIDGSDIKLEKRDGDCEQELEEKLEIPEEYY